VFKCFGHNVLAERDADLESNLFLLARKLLPAYHDGAPQYCRVCGLISALVQLFLSFFSPSISPRQKFDKAPTPQNVEQNILEYIDRKNKDNFFTTNLL